MTFWSNFSGAGNNLYVLHASLLDMLQMMIIAICDIVYTSFGHFDLPHVVLAKRHSAPSLSAGTKRPLIARFTVSLTITRLLNNMQQKNLSRKTEN